MPTILPTPLNTLLATATLLMTVRAPDMPEATMTPRTQSLPVVAAATGTAVATETASVIPAATSALFTCDLMAPPRFGPELGLNCGVDAVHAVRP
jgi:hypothetical protein